MKALAFKLDNFEHGAHIKGFPETEHYRRKQASFYEFIIITADVPSEDERWRCIYVGFLSILGRRRRSDYCIFYAKEWWPSLNKLFVTGAIHEDTKSIGKSFANVPCSVRISVWEGCFWSFKYCMENFVIWFWIAWIFIRLRKNWRSIFLYYELIRNVYVFIIFIAQLYYSIMIVIRYTIIIIMYNHSIPISW